jgi:hypothetical protein
MNQNHRKPKGVRNVTLEKRYAFSRRVIDICDYIETQAISEVFGFPYLICIEERLTKVCILVLTNIALFWPFLYGSGFKSGAKSKFLSILFRKA